MYAGNFSSDGHIAPSWTLQRRIKKEKRREKNKRKTKKKYRKKKLWEKAQFVVDPNHKKIGETKGNKQEKGRKTKRNRKKRERRKRRKREIKKIRKRENMGIELFIYFFNAWARERLHGY